MKKYVNTDNLGLGNHHSNGNYELLSSNHDSTYIDADTLNIGTLVDAQFRSVAPNTIIVSAPNGDPLIEIDEKGIHFKNGYTPEETALVFWEAISQLNPYATQRKLNEQRAITDQKQKEIERLLQENKDLKQLAQKAMDQFVKEINKKE